MSDIQQVKDIFKRADVSLVRDDCWAVQQATVVKHKALERLAAALKITYSAPQILRAEKDEAVILVTGKIGEVSEWSIGEACVNVNYKVSGRQAAYVYAMAEKRAKDRVILKLAGLHGIYSEDEADDFKQPLQAQKSTPAGQSEQPQDDNAAVFYEMMEAAIAKCATEAQLTDLWRKNNDAAKATSQEAYDWLAAECGHRKAQIKQQNTTPERNAA